VRKYTALSARSLACFLADARDPEAALCPHEPVRPVESHAPLSFDQAEHTLSRRTSVVTHLANGHVAQKRANGKRPTTLRRSSNQTASLGSDDSQASQIPTFKRPNLHQASKQPAKDPKSFTQALFDTLPVRLLEWLPRTPQRTTSHDYHLETSYGTNPEPHKGGVYRKPIVRGDSHKSAAARSKDEGTYRVNTLNGSAIGNGHVKEPNPSAPRKPVSIKVTLGNGGLDTSAPSLPTPGELDDEVRPEESSRRQYEGSGSPHMLDGPVPNPQQSSSLGPEGDKSLSVPTSTSLSTEILKELKDLHSKTGKDLSKSDLSKFFKQSLYYCLKDPRRLSASFEAPESCGLDPEELSPSGQEQWLSRLNPQSLRINLTSMSVLCSWPEIIRNLSIAIYSLHIPARSRHHPHPAPALNDRQAARVCVIGLYALSELLQTVTHLPDDALSVLFDRVRGEGMVQPFSKHFLELCDVFDDFESLSLLEKIVNVIANRLTSWEISKAHRNVDLGNHEKKPPNMIQSILDYMADDTTQKLKVMTQMNTSMEHSERNEAMSDSLGNGFLSRLTLYWLRTLMLRDWDGRTSVRKSDTVGIVLQILAAMYEKHRSIGLEPKEFWTQVFVKRFDPFDMPMEWLAFRSDNKTVHLLSYSFLFPPETVVTYFRAINYSRMTKSTDGAILTKRAYGEFVASANSYQIPVTRRETLEQRLGITGQPRFVIEVRRDNVLADAINQIWRRQHRELLNPLKVRMGTDEGEEGVDSGGVQQELFRVLFEQALDPSYGMFTVDEQTRMIWFQPESLEPLFKFEALGILMSLAVYNSITLPLTFPIAFYRKLLGLKVKKLDQIKDGWPILAENLQSLLEWKAGDVAEVFMRTYEFSYEAFGKTASIDIERTEREVPWPPQPTRKGKEKAKTASFDVPPAGTSKGRAIPVSRSMASAKDATKEDGHQAEALEASLVTNANREHYVKDYIFWLTDKSIRPQYEAFARGFHACLDRTALSIFTAEALQSFIEGVQEIDIEGLQASTVYDGYTADDQVIRWFWEAVKSWDHRRKKLLLEFVTASDRVPVNGVSVIGFVIQNNGPSDEILPRSMTCFATLLLPQYSSKEVLERRLGIAVEHAKGFGTI
jgi:hypothetical protein